MKIIKLSYHDLVGKDNELLHIEKVIEMKRQMLLDKCGQLQTVQKENKFLGVIKNEYNDYLNYILKQKQDQIQALNRLNEYINELHSSNELSKYNMDDSKQEQQKIINEINSIKDKLNELISKTSGDKTIEKKDTTIEKK
jgi:hypothetical protein